MRSLRIFPTLLVGLGAYAQMGTPAYIANSTWTDAEVLAMTQPATVAKADREKGLVSTDLATRYASFTSRLGTWLPTDDYKWWNFSQYNRAEAQDAYWTIADKANQTSLTWTGNLTTGAWGSCNQDFRDAVYRYLNYNRYLFYTGASRVRYMYEASKFLDMTQAAAMVTVLNPLKWDHTIDSSFTGYSDLARQGCANSDLGFGNIAKVSSWDGYMVDWGNSYPGHRFWQLNPYATSVAIGVCHPVANTTTDATWVDRSSSTAYPVVYRDPIKAATFYPYPGYVPCTMLDSALNDDGDLMFSVSFEQGNASLWNGGSIYCTPTITVKRDGIVLPIVKQYTMEKHIVFKVNIASGTVGTTAYNNQFSTANFGEDQKYEVTIDGLYFIGRTTPFSPTDGFWMDPAAALPRSLSYSFTIYNPAKTASSSAGSASLVYGLSTRARIGQGDNVLIGGLFITGKEPMRVMLRAQGPSLMGAVANYATDPKFEIHQIGGSSPVSLGTNDNWKDGTNYRMVESFGFAPGNTNEAAAIATLMPGLYTITVSDLGTGGVGIVEAYAVDSQSCSQLSGVSTRGVMGSGEEAMIAGFILQSEKTVVISAKGPSMASAGVAGTVADPKLKIIRMGDSAQVGANDDWDVTANARLKTDLAWAAPLNSKEAALVITLPAGAYTVLGESKSTAGVGIVEVYRTD